MALVFMDSCSWYNADIKYKYDGWLGSFSGADSLTRRTGATSIYFDDSGTLRLDLERTKTVIMGAAYYYRGIPSSSNWVVEFDSHKSNTDPVYLGIGDNSKVFVQIGLFGTKYYSPSSTIAALAWYHIEIKIVKHPTAGVIQVRVGESLVIDLSAINTGDIDDDFNVINWEGVGTWNMQDIYVCDGDGGVNDDFLGDVKVNIIRPSSAGTHTDFIPSTGDNWENVDEVTIDGDTTYNQSTFVGDKDTYNMENVSIPGDIYGIQQLSVMRKSDVGQYRAKQLLLSNITESLGNEIVLGDSYVGYKRTFDLNPDTDTVWTEASLNAVESGIQTVASLAFIGVASISIVTSVPGTLVTT